MVAEVPLEVLDSLMMSENVASAASYLLHVVTRAHNHLRQLQLKISKFEFRNYFVKFPTTVDKGTNQSQRCLDENA